MTDEEWANAMAVQIELLNAKGDNKIMVRVSNKIFDEIVLQAKRRDRSAAAMVAIILREGIASRKVVQKETAA